MQALKTSFGMAPKASTRDNKRRTVQITLEHGRLTATSPLIDASEEVIEWIKQHPDRPEARAWLMKRWLSKKSAKEVSLLS